MTLLRFFCHIWLCLCNAVGYKGANLKECGGLGPCVVKSEHSFLYLYIHLIIYLKAYD